jgi:hypothetical protein
MELQIRKNVFIFLLFIYLLLFSTFFIGTLFYKQKFSHSFQKNSFEHILKNDEHNNNTKNNNNHVENHREHHRKGRASTARVLWPNHLTRHEPGLIVGWNSSTMLSVCLMVVSNVDIETLQRALDALRSRMSHVDVAQLANGGATGGDEADEARLLQSLLSTHDNNSFNSKNGDDNSSGGAALLERISQQFTQSLFVGASVAERPLARLARLFTATSFPSILGTWCHTSSSSSSLSSSNNLQTLSSPAKAKSGVWLSLSLRKPSTQNCKFDTSFWQSFTNPREDNNENNVVDNNNNNAKKATKHSRVPITALVECYGYTLSSVQIVLFDAMASNHYFAAFPLVLDAALPALARADVAEDDDITWRGKFFLLLLLIDNG